MDVLIHDLQAMGTVFRFTFAASDRDVALSALPGAVNLITEADETFSTYKPHSEVSRLNRAELTFDQASDDVRLIAEACKIWRAKTRGGFSAQSPGGDWDPSGIVKAWAAQSSAHYLEAHGIRNFSLNAGGDVLLGSSAQAELQRVGLAATKPIAENGFQAEVILDLSATGYRAVATSGSVERGNHIWGVSSDIVQVSVVGLDLISADVWATAIYASGAELLPILEQGGLAALVTLSDGSKIQTSNFSQMVQVLAHRIGA